MFDQLAGLFCLGDDANRSDRFLPTPQRSGKSKLISVARGAEIVGNLFGGLQCAMEVQSLFSFCALAMTVDCFQQFLFRLRAEAFDVFYLAGFSSGL